MGTPHIAAARSDIAERILLPGDPLRAKHIAETFLEGAQQYTGIRNMLGFTGRYKGVPVSVQGTGMGIPSISIYVHELIQFFGVERLIRVGTCGAMHRDIRVRDVVIAQAASTDSSVIRNVFGGSINFAPIADYGLLSAAVAQAEKLSVPVKVGNVISVDRFYDDEIDNSKLTRYGILAVEMEAAALYLIAAQFHRKALAIFTASNHLITGEECTAEERQTSFNDMIRIALETAIQ